MIMVCQAKIVHLVPGITNWFGKWKFIYRIQKIIPIFTKSNGKKTTAQSFAPYFSTIGVLLARQTKQFVWRVWNNESSLCVCRLNKTYWRIVFQDCFTYETHNKWRNRTYVCSAAINEKAIKKKLMMNANGFVGSEWRESANTATIGPDDECITGML